MCPVQISTDVHGTSHHVSLEKSYQLNQFRLAYEKRRERFTLLPSPIAQMHLGDVYMMSALTSARCSIRCNIDI